MTGEISTFRGYQAIRTVVSTMETLAEGLAHRRSPAQTMTLRARDYDLIVRWPKASELHGIVINEGGPFWRGFALRREHGRPLPQRSEKRQGGIAL